MRIDKLFLILRAARKAGKISKTDSPRRFPLRGPYRTRIFSAIEATCMEFNETHCWKVEFE